MGVGIGECFQPHELDKFIDFTASLAQHPTRDQAQAASEVVFGEVQRLYYGLREGGRRRAVRAARAARRAAADAAEAAGRRPLAG